MKVPDQALAFLISITSCGLINALELRNKNIWNLWERSKIQDTNRKDRMTEAFGSVTVTTNADGTEPSSKYYLFLVDEDDDAGNSACSSLRRFGVEKEDCTYLESLKIGFFKPPDGRKTVTDALTHGDLGLHIVTVESDQEVRPNEVSDTFQSWNLDDTDGTDRHMKFEYEDIADASGIVVVIMDTGIDFDDKQFANVQKYMGKSFIKEDQDVYSDPHGHGTHCAGSAVGNTVGTRLRNVQLAAVKVLNANARGSFVDMVNGINWLAEESDNNPNTNYVTSMSLGGGYSSIVNEVVNNVANRPNVDVVVSAGKDDSNPCLESPASAEASKTVRGLGMDITKYHSSNHENCVDLYAPIANIDSSFSAGASLHGRFEMGMVAPYVARAIAIAKAKDVNEQEIFRQNCIKSTPEVCLSNLI